MVMAVAHLLYHCRYEMPSRKLMRAEADSDETRGSAALWSHDKGVDGKGRQGSWEV